MTDNGSARRRRQTTMTTIATLSAFATTAAAAAAAALAVAECFQCGVASPARPIIAAVGGLAEIMSDDASCVNYDRHAMRHESPLSSSSSSSLSLSLLSCRRLSINRRPPASSTTDRHYRRHYCRLLRRWRLMHFRLIAAADLSRHDQLQTFTIHRPQITSCKTVTFNYAALEYSKHRMTRRRVTV